MGQVEHHVAHFLTGTESCPISVEFQGAIIEYNCIIIDEDENFDSNSMMAEVKSENSDQIGNDLEIFAESDGPLIQNHSQSASFLSLSQELPVSKSPDGSGQSTPIAKDLCGLLILEGTPFHFQWLLINCI